MSNKVSTLLWNLGNGFIGIFIIWLTDINYIYTPVIVSSLNLITKELNKEFNPNYKKND